MGTWIEMLLNVGKSISSPRRALMGTWIEIYERFKALALKYVVPSWARGLKFYERRVLTLAQMVVPSWARGLKSGQQDVACNRERSCPHGHVD